MVIDSYLPIVHKRFVLVFEVLNPRTCRLWDFYQCFQMLHLIVPKQRTPEESDLFSSWRSGSDCSWLWFENLFIQILCTATHNAVNSETQANLLFGLTIAKIIAKMINEAIQIFRKLEQDYGALSSVTLKILILIVIRMYQEIHQKTCLLKLRLNMLVINVTWTFGIIKQFHSCASVYSIF